MSKSDSLSSFVTGLCLGLLNGLLFGILFAPRSGTQLNRAINRFVENLPYAADDPSLAVLQKTRLKIASQVDRLGDAQRARREARARNLEARTYGDDIG
jgi:gas vesicle protein